MKAIIAIDSFKGCLTSAEAGKAALKAFADGEAEVIPVSDGGEGFSTILTESLGGSFRTVSCHDPLGRSIKRDTESSEGPLSSKPPRPADLASFARMSSIPFWPPPTAQAN